MLKTEHFESSTGHSWESSSAVSEDSAVDSDYVCSDDEDNDQFSEISGDSEQDGDAEEGEDQDTDTNEHEHKYQHTDTDKEESEAQTPEQGKGENEALNENLDLAVGKRSARNEDNLALSTPHVPQLNSSPTTEPYYDTIALGQHHIWI